MSTSKGRNWSRTFLKAVTGPLGNTASSHEVNRTWEVALQAHIRPTSKSKWLENNTEVLGAVNILIYSPFMQCIDGGHPIEPSPCSLVMKSPRTAVLCKSLSGLHGVQVRQRLLTPMQFYMHGLTECKNVCTTQAFVGQPSICGSPPKQINLMDTTSHVLEIAWICLNPMKRIQWIQLIPQNVESQTPTIPSVCLKPRGCIDPPCTGVGTFKFLPNGWRISPRHTHLKLRSKYELQSSLWTMLTMPS